ncbi:MAG TPA: MFS transporter [Candidatus Gracilibacteria bacterium]|nr:MFS transporter [Candidatus Gracilibacteria bacterium]
MQILDTPKQRKILPIILLTIFIDMIGVGILIPVMPMLLADPESQYYLLAGVASIGTMTVVQSGYIIYGLLNAIFPFMQFLSAPILGQLSDKYGRKKILGISISGTFISYIVFAIAIYTRNIPLLFVSRMVYGIMGGNISVAQAAIADITKPENRAKNFGLIGATFGLGMIVGPYIGGKLSDPSVSTYFTATTPFIAAALLSLINVIFIITVFKETHLNRNKDLKITITKGFNNIKRIISLKHLRALLATNFFFQGGFSFFTSFFAVSLIDRFNFTQGNIGDYFAYAGFWIIIAQAVVLRIVTKRFQEHQILMVTLLTLSIFIGLNFTLTASWQLFLLAPFYAMSNGLSHANMSSLISRSAGPQVQGEILGINSSVASLAITIPTLLSGFIAAKLTPETPIIIASIIIFIAWLIFSISFHRGKIYRPEIVKAD